MRLVRVRCASAGARVAVSELRTFAQLGNGWQETTELFREIKEDGSGFTERDGLVSGVVAIYDDGYFGIGVYGLRVSRLLRAVPEIHGN